MSRPPRKRKPGPAPTPQQAATFNQALTDFRAGRIVQAEAGLAAITLALPGWAEGWHMRGLVAQAGRHLHQARTYLEQAIALDGGVANYHANLCAVLMGLRDLAAAEQAARGALKVDARHFGAMMNLGLVLSETGRLRDAQSWFETAATLQPKLAGVHANVGRVAALRGDYGAALAAYRRAAEQAPEAPEHALGQANALYLLGRTGESRTLLDAAVTRWPESLELLGARTFVLNYFADVTAEQQAAAARAYGTALAKRATPMRHVPDPTAADRSVRVGFVSSDLREHSVSHFLMAVLPGLDRDRLVPVAYSTSRHADARTEALRTHFAEWVDAALLDAPTLARKIVEDRIDLLVDLSGHTQGHRLPVFGLKPAPVSLSWLGYSGTTGVGTIDYLVADRWVVPEGDEPFLSERPWRLPHGYLCFPPAQLPPRPRTMGEGGFTFGSFNSHNKLSPETLSAWAEILKGVPGSRLLLKSRGLADPETAAATRAAFESMGVAADRLTLLGRTPTLDAHLDLYGEMDIALDPFPYNGTTTTMEALRMGVPVLSLKGDRYISRVGWSLLANAGLEDWVAPDVDAYVAQAIARAADPAGLQMLRSELPARVATAPIADAQRFARDFSDMLVTMWREWCQSAG